MQIIHMRNMAITSCHAVTVEWPHAIRFKPGEMATASSIHHDTAITNR
ncbi:hypothetical protein IG197_06370 [Aminobacter sp. SR38]|nr:hypothetical protein [Aminobacter sp. SR38]QOF72691.1 hypothetical protein IG197_06370 [Aminobacter sp. SR38]